MFHSNVTNEVDTDCGYTIMSRRAFHKLFKDTKKPRLAKRRIKLRTYSGHRVLVLGAAKVKVEHEGTAEDVSSSGQRFRHKSSGTRVDEGSQGRLATCT